MRHFGQMLLVCLWVAVILVSVTSGCARPAPFITSHQPQVRGLTDGVKIQAILTTGDAISDQYTMAAVPDGLGAIDNGDGTFTLLMNHELGSGEHLTDSRVSKLVIDKKTLHVLDGKYLINGSEGYRRFCSATMVGRREGFEENLFLTGEEATDSSHGGIAVAINPRTDTHTDLPWLGYFPHENVIALPGYKGKIVVLTTEDNSHGPSYLYMYVANNQKDFLAGKGQLYVFVADAGTTPAAISKAQQRMGGFVAIDQSENKNAQTLRDAAVRNGAMAFTRLEDLVYAVNHDGLVYFDTTGSSEYLNPATGGPYDAKGRVYAMQLDLADPSNVTSLSVLLDGNDGDDILNPDNLAASDKSIMIQEDLNDEFQGQRVGRVLRYDLSTRTLTPVAEIVQQDDGGKEIPGDKLGSWESSGIINMAEILGPDQWLLVTQADTLNVSQFGKEDDGGQLMLMTVPGSASKG